MLSAFDIESVCVAFVSICCGSGRTLSLASSMLRFVAHTALLADDKNSTWYIGHNSDGLGGVRIRCFHVFLFSVPTTNNDSKSSMFDSF